RRTGVHAATDVRQDQGTADPQRGLHRTAHHARRPNRRRDPGDRAGIPGKTSGVAGNGADGAATAGRHARLPGALARVDPTILPCAGTHGSAEGTARPGHSRIVTLAPNLYAPSEI